MEFVGYYVFDENTRTYSYVVRCGSEEMGKERGLTYKEFQDVKFMLNHVRWENSIATHSYYQ